MGIKRYHELIFYSLIRIDFYDIGMNSTTLPRIPGLEAMNTEQLKAFKTILLGDQLILATELLLRGLILYSRGNSNCDDEYEKEIFRKNFHDIKGLVENFREDLERIHIFDPIYALGESFNDVVMYLPDSDDFNDIRFYRMDNEATLSNDQPPLLFKLEVCDSLFSLLKQGAEANGLL